MASRAALSSAVTSRSGVIGQAATRVCQSSQALFRSGQGPAAAVHAAASSAQIRGCSARTARRALASALRLVSWVDSAVMVCGQRRSIRSHQAWKSAGGTPGRAGSPPTSFSAGSALKR